VVAVWADDQWLVEHAGATLNTADNADDAGTGEVEADSTAEKEAETETVSSLLLRVCQMIDKVGRFCLPIKLANKNLQSVIQKSTNFLC